MPNKNVSRRDFLKRAGVVAGGLAVVSLPGVLHGLTAQKASAAPSEAPATKRAGAKAVASADVPTHDWAFVVDTERCIGCGNCVRACKNENKVPWEPEYNRTWVERYTITEDDQVYVDSPNAGRDGFREEPANIKYQNLNVSKAFFVPKLCNQCEKPPCVSVCPVGATYKTKEGVVLVDQFHCVGCRYCVQACPYGARYVLPTASETYFGQVHVVDKCTWCYHRTTKGLLPACVEVCPRGARMFGDLSDPNSTVSTVLREKRVYTLKPELGTEPKVYYLGFEKGVM